MFSWILKKFAKITILGKILEKLGPKFPIILLFTFIIFMAFYGPYEYENYLEFKEKYPTNDFVLISLKNSSGFSLPHIAPKKPHPQNPNAVALSILLTSTPPSATIL
mgnify:CR=1 FL=1